MVCPFSFFTLKQFLSDIKCKTIPVKKSVKRGTLSIDDYMTNEKKWYLFCCASYCGDQAASLI